MPVQQRVLGNFVPSSERVLLTRAAARLKPVACTLTVMLALTSVASAASLSRSVDVAATPAAVWSMIGPFCAIKDWHPAIGVCAETVGTVQTRRLVTKDGKATFEETQTGRNDADHRYSYIFISSPLPVTNYTSTLQVTAKDQDRSTITWSSTYTPDRGKEQAASEALRSIYDAGLRSIKTKFDE